MNSQLSSHSSARPSGLRYAVAIFLSSSLLFLIEPIAAKRLLPLLGGSAAVWTACLVFFQCALLLGYLLAHWLVTRAGARAQVTAYVALLVLSLGQLAIGISPSLRASPAHPILSVLWLLTVLIGLPFVTLSATSPLLQAWYARSADVANTTTINAPRPYRLFAVSNAGSLLALLVYPWLIEPRMSLHDQTVAVVAGFTMLAVVCGAIAYSMRSATTALAATTPDPTPATNVAEPRTTPDAQNRVLWVALAACGSLLLSAVTNHISQNVATLPLFWIIPLVAYLLTFVVAFSGERWQPRWLVLTLALAGLGGAGYVLYKGDLSMSIPRVTGVFCGALFALCLFCHSELHRRRPPPQQLTVFYFCLAAGGALGAILVGVVAPSVLPGNYDLAIGLCFAAALGVAATWTSGAVARVFWFAVTAAMAWLVLVQVRNDRPNLIARTRNFYGTLRVTETSEPEYSATMRRLDHGVIMHGQQIFRTDLRQTPTTYYGRNSGVGLALDLCCNGRPRRVGVIGLGTGTIAAYGRAGDVFRFYDINPAVEPIARTYFTYLRDSPARIEVATGDARISLAAEPPQRYDVLAIDAFSGDAIPVHLITTEALSLYRRHLTPNGIVAFHVSNRFLDLAPVVEQLAERAGMKTAFISSADNTKQNVYTSDWVLVTADTVFLSLPAVVTASEEITIPRRLRLWTDDYNSLLPILRMRSNDST
ncbi:MAG: fused MFS/spermidine synthase [bacterium]